MASNSFNKSRAGPGHVSATLRVILNLFDFCSKCLCMTVRLFMLLTVGVQMYPVRNLLLTPKVPPDLMKSVSTSWKCH